jgi:hypothetical protein
MKSGFFSRGNLIASLLAVFFASTAAAQAEPTWVKEGVDWKQYSKFLVRPLVVDNVKVIKPPYAQDDPSEWTLSVRDLEGVQAIFRDVMSDVLSGNGGYPLVYGDGEDVLEVEVELLNIMPWVKPGGDEDYEGFVVKTLGSGEVTGRVELRDSQGVYPGQQHLQHRGHVPEFCHASAQRDGPGARRLIRILPSESRHAS